MLNDLTHRLYRFLSLATASLALIISAVVSMASAQGVGDPPGFERAKAALDRNIGNVLSIDGVGGMGVGLGAGGEAVLVITANRSDVAGLPRRIDGVNVRVLQTGPFFANPKPDCQADPTHPSCSDSGGTIDPTAEWPEPVPTGVSIGNQKSCSAGTFGARVTDGSKKFLLSNNHVLAEGNTADIGADAEKDDTTSDSIHQPGRYDTNCVGSNDQKIGVLYRFVPIDFSTSASNTVDAAIALNDPVVHRAIGNATPDDGYGMPSSTTTDSILGMKVQKYGRTTGLTNGEIVIDPWIGNVGYSQGTARFVDQIVVYRRRGGPFLKSGDSGSLLVTNKKNNPDPVGLVFAGDSSGKYGIANKIDHVLDALGGVWIDDN